MRCVTALVLAGCGSAHDSGSSPIDGDASQGSGFLHQDGTQIVDGGQRPVRLHGVNLGGWLNWEGWLWGGVVADAGSNAETQVMSSLTKLVGSDEAEQFRQAVYDRFVTEADIQRIAALGYDSVRVPFNHRLLEDDAAPYVYRDEGWAVLDGLLDWCERYRLYAVLDLHSAPGGQSDVFVSDRDPTNLWESSADEDRTIALWRAIVEDSTFASLIR